jgi:hypothetical protein
MYVVYLCGGRADTGRMQAEVEAEVWDATRHDVAHILEDEEQMVSLVADRWRVCPVHTVLPKRACPVHTVLPKRAGPIFATPRKNFSAASVLRLILLAWVGVQDDCVHNHSGSCCIRCGVWAPGG